MPKVLVTGATAELGFSIAEIFARANYSVILADSNQKKLTDRLRDLPQSGKEQQNRIWRVDYEEKGAVLDVEDTIDVLVNTWGVGTLRELIDAPELDHAKIVDESLHPSIVLSRNLIRRMIRNNVSGSVIFVTENVDQAEASEERTEVAKAALAALTKVLKKQVQGHGIEIDVVAPGVIESQTNGHTSEATFKPQDAAAAVFKVAKS